jgi:hypothetical protein
MIAQAWPGSLETTTDRKETSMGYKASSKAGGWTNPIKVRCSQCSATLFINASAARNAGGWECPHCGRKH